MDSMRRMVGLGGSSESEKKPAQAPKAKPTSRTARAKASDDKKQEDKKQTAKPAKPNADATRPQTQEANAAPAQQQQQAPQASFLSGAQPTVPSGSFDNRFGSWR
jgi:hypothetical protein